MTKQVKVRKVSTKQNVKFGLGVAEKMLKTFNTDVSRHCLDLLEKREFQAYLNLDIDPKDYSDPNSFFLDYQSINVLKKWELLPTDIDTAMVARKKFMEAESDNRRTNQSIWEGRFSGLNKANSVFHLAVKAKIEKILGTCPDITDLNCRFGPGATSSTKGDSVILPEKFLAAPECTQTAVPILQELFESDRLLGETLIGQDIEVGSEYSILPDNFHIVPGNRFTTVPKSAKTDRPICIEPHLNTLIQKGVGAHIRKKLRHSGLDLNKQADRNRIYAQQGSKYGTYATIDLSAASDMISLGIVQSLLPHKWFELLDSARSPYTFVENNVSGPDKSGFWIQQHKFSSMGNGFTFELESLIFYAMVQVISDLRQPRGVVMTFGDDIIVPSSIAAEVVLKLQLFGFKINEEKSFLSGPFRESCGSDFFNGIAVRPYQLKKEIKDEKGYIPILNGIKRRSALDLSGVAYCDSRWKPAWTFVLAHVPKSLRLYGPAILGDAVIHRARVDSNVKINNESMTLAVKGIRPEPRKRSLERYGARISIPSMLIMSGKEEPTKGLIAIRGSLAHYRSKSFRVSLYDWPKYSGRWV